MLLRHVAVYKKKKEAVDVYTNTKNKVNGRKFLDEEELLTCSFQPGHMNS